MCHLQGSGTISAPPCAAGLACDKVSCSVQSDPAACGLRVSAHLCHCSPSGTQCVNGQCCPNTNVCGSSSALTCCCCPATCCLFPCLPAFAPSVCNTHAVCLKPCHLLPICRMYACNLQPLRHAVRQRPVLPQHQRVRLLISAHLLLLSCHLLPVLLPACLCTCFAIPLGLIPLPVSCLLCTRPSSQPLGHAVRRRPVLPQHQRLRLSLVPTSCCCPATCCLLFSLPLHCTTQSHPVPHRF
jgi:hypothetical protein